MLLIFLTVVTTNKQLPLNVSNHLLNYAASLPRRPRSNYVYGCTFQKNRQTDKLNVNERNAQSNFQDVFGVTTHFIRIITPRSLKTIRTLAAIVESADRFSDFQAVWTQCSYVSHGM